MVRQACESADDKDIADSHSGSRLATWFEAKGRGIVHDGERVRLALCPGVRKIIGFYETLGC